MKLNKFKFFFILIVVSFLVFPFFSSFVFAEERGLEVEYPEIEGEKISEKTTLPEYVIYIFKLSLIIAAIAAFAVLTYGGIRYLLSLNNPEAIKDARTWISSGVIGLFIILASYLILTTINPEIVTPSLKPIEPVTGIYLLNSEGEEKYISQSQDKIPFESVSLEFISTEDELYSVFTCSKEEFDPENSKEIKNDGGTHPVNNVKSIYFLWNRPGVYLYAKPNHDTPPPPRFFQSSSDYLGDFNNRTKSVRIKDDESQFSYLTILFSEPDFEGGNGIGVAIKDSYNLNYVKNEISSINVSGVISLSEAPADGGEVIFYDDIDCNKKDHSKSIKAGSSPGGSSFSQFNEFGKSTNFTDWSVLSFEIKGNCWVIFNTEVDFSGRSQIFKKEGCYPTLKGSYIYHPHPDIEREPKTATVFYTPD
jgi:hypothetical protein